MPDLNYPFPMMRTHRADLCILGTGATYSQTSHIPVIGETNHSNPKTFLSAPSSKETDPPIRMPKANMYVLVRSTFSILTIQMPVIRISFVPLILILSALGEVMNTCR